jgi:hypothetical protein
MVAFNVASSQTIEVSDAKKLRCFKIANFGHKELMTDAAAMTVPAQ